MPTHQYGRRRAIALGAASLVAAPTIVTAQAVWKPDRPITVYNPLAAGGVTDVHLRFLGERVSKLLGQQVIVDVKAGAAATLAAAQLLNFKPDGHTIACMTINSLRYPHYQQTNWHPLRDFTYILGLSAYTFGVVCKSDAPWKTIDDLIAAGKKEPEKYNYGTSGIGGTGHLLMIETEQATGAKFTHVPYKGGAEWMQALLGGHIHFVPDGAQWAPFVDNGQVRVLAMATEKRFPKYPDTPTLVERGINAVAHSPYGLVGPKDLPAGIVGVLHDAFKQAMDDSAHQPLLDRYIQVPWYKSPAEYRAFAEKYFVDVKPVLVRAGLAKD
ncbi:MAG: tripartite tricarboxylate transporter substrate binding protein [Alphaproteobacteria bacterium]|nr:tripartite tricarboxylate transporter substrate binding protein [Alphaproteobacteria bacterium]